MIPTQSIILFKFLLSHKEQDNFSLEIIYHWIYWNRRNILFMKKCQGIILFISIADPLDKKSTSSENFL